VRVALLIAVAACAEGSLEAPDAPPIPPDAVPPDAAPPPDADPPPLYPSDRTLSPVTPAIARALRALAGADPTLNEDVFEKVGASTTVSTQFLVCLAGAGVDLGGRAELAPTIDFFNMGDAGGATPFERVSLAADEGQNVTWALAGSPPPIDQETMALLPRYALIQFGTNDVNQIGIHDYAAAMLDLVDRLAVQGVVPILSSVQPNNLSATADALVPRFNLVARGIAQGRRLPFMDLHRELLPLPDRGLGSDGIHLSVDPAGSCRFTADGLTHGYTVKNLITLQSLARARAALVGAPPDAPSASLAGAGSSARPFVIPSLPFTDLRDTTGSPDHEFATYSPCGAGQNESGPEYVYRLDLSAPTTIRATVFVRGGVDIDVQVLNQLAADACLERNDKEIVIDLPPGTFYLLLDTFVPADGSARVGEYLLTVQTE